jgi:lysozyme
MKELIENIKESEGFKGVVYKCTEGFDTIGYGTRLPLSEEETSSCANPTKITKQEAEIILEIRLKKFIKDLEYREPFVNKISIEKQEIIAEMCYQLGVGGVLKFKGMWKALKAFDYVTASEEMLDSLWYRQMHEADMKDGRDSVNRAERLALKMRVE